MIEIKSERIALSELLIKELYIDLRRSVNKWSKITNQTPQARMGYVGQHLVSVVTGFPGGKSGARGYDLIIDNETTDCIYGEIKTCYRVDQLGTCNICQNVVSSLETECSSCNTNDIKRNDDSKWLISIRNYNELTKITEPLYYYFVLFEFEEIYSKTNHNIVASIWKVNPKVPGFELGMLDYYYNIRANSDSKAPFNMWPHMLKFHLTRPMLIYKSIIYDDDTIKTIVFNNELDYSVEEPLQPLTFYAKSRNLTIAKIQKTMELLNIPLPIKALNKTKLLSYFQEQLIISEISNSSLADALSISLYRDDILPHLEYIPENLTTYL